jgi:hypothetical protein
LREHAIAPRRPICTRDQRPLVAQKLNLVSDRSNPSLRRAGFV